MARENQRKYPIFDQLSTEELQKLLAQDFTATDEDPDVDYIMAIMEVITERKKAAEHRVDVDAAWKEFQENYQGQAAAYEPAISCETESSDHHKTPPAQVTQKKKSVFRYVLVAAILVVLLCGTASGFGSVFQAVVNWTAETFGFEAPYRVEESGENACLNDPYAKLRTTIAEYTELPVIPKWAPPGTKVSPAFGVQQTARKDSAQIAAVYETDAGRFTILIQIHHEEPPQYTGSYQWDEEMEVIPYTVSGINHDIIYNSDDNLAAWTHEQVECMIQGDLSVDELKRMIDSIYEE